MLHYSLCRKATAAALDEFGRWLLRDARGDEHEHDTLRDAKIAGYNQFINSLPGDA